MQVRLQLQRQPEDLRGRPKEVTERQAQRTESTEDGANGASQTADQKLDMIMTMMKKVAVKEDLVQMQTSLLWKVDVQTKSSIEEAVSPLKSEIHDLKARVQVLEKPHDTGGGLQDSGLKQKMNEIEKELAGLQTSATVINVGQGNNIVIVGGLDARASFEEAGIWIAGKLESGGVPNPVEKFIKGDEGFKGHVWVRFAETAAMNAAIAMFARVEVVHGGGGKVWCNKDQPHSFRTARKFLIDFKKLLVKWEFNKKAIDFDEDTLTMSVEKKPALEVKVQEGELKLTWVDGVWGSWKELVEAEEVQTLLMTASDALKIAKELRAKGSGKGKRV